MAEATKGDAASEGDATQKRERSAIGFPYQDLADSMEAARTIYSHVGTGTCEESQLAAWLGLSPNSSGFRVRLSSARLFNLIEGGSGAVRVTDLGLRGADSKQERAAKVEAFLRIPLYSALYERFKAGSLPPASAVEREMVSLGVAEKQKDRARQVFYRSAEEAGFFESGKDRLVKPGVAPLSSSGPEEIEAPVVQHGGGSGGGGTLDPLLQALIQKLPSSGTTWSADERVMWLQMITMAFQMSYGQDAAIQIKKVDAGSAAVG